MDIILSELPPFDPQGSAPVSQSHSPGATTSGILNYFCTVSTPRREMGISYRTFQSKSRLVCILEKPHQVSLLPFSNESSNSKAVAPT